MYNDIQDKSGDYTETEVTSRAPTPPRKKKHRCSICYDYTTVSPTHYKKHMEVHKTNPNPLNVFQCPHCIYSSNRKDTLNNHNANIHPLVD